MTTYFKQGLDVTGNISLSGDISIGGNAYGGDSDTDSVTFTADITSNILPDASLTYNLGINSKQWNELHVNNIYAANEMTVGGDVTITGITNITGDTTITGNLEVSGTVRSPSPDEHLLGEVVINTDQISTNTGFELKLSSPTNLVLEPTDNIWISQGTKLIFEGTAPDDFEIKLQATAVTADREIILPDAGGTLALQSFVTDYISGTGNTLGDWTVVNSGGTLYFKHNGVNKMSLDSSGNLTVVGDITAFGTL
jgi:hypothetical protein